MNSARNTTKEEPCAADRCFALQQNPEVYQQQAMAVLFNNLPILLKGEPVITDHRHR